MGVFPSQYRGSDGYPGFPFFCGRQSSNSSLGIASGGVIRPHSELRTQVPSRSKITLIRVSIASFMVLDSQYRTILAVSVPVFGSFIRPEFFLPMLFLPHTLHVYSNIAPLDHIKSSKRRWPGNQLPVDLVTHTFLVLFSFFFFPFLPPSPNNILVTLPFARSLRIGDSTFAA